MGIILRHIAMVGLVLALASGRAHADSAADAAEAKRLYFEGQKHYNLGEFQPAIEQFKRAYQLTAKAGLLFNIAQAHRLSGDFKQALFFYESYLRGQPDAKNRVEVEGRIIEMREAAAKVAAVKEPPNGTVTPDSEPGPSTGPDASTAPVASPSPAPAPRAPTPGEVAAQSAAGREAAAAPTGADARDRPRPVYKKWWFWAGVGAVAVGAAAVIVVATSGGASGAPDTDFPIVDAY